MKLREILLLIKDLTEISDLPRKLDSLTSFLERNLPILPVRCRTIPVDARAQSTQQSKDFVAKHYWYDQEALFSSILASYLASEKMHFGMAEFADNPVELWQSRAWGSSIRATSGEFAYAANGDVLFPGDFVELEKPLRFDTEISTLFGRVIFIGRDKRSFSPTQNKVMVILQAVIFYDQIPCTITQENCPQTLVLVEDREVELIASSVKNRVNIEMCYVARDAASQRINTVLNLKHKYLRPATKIHPLRAELEIAHYGRDHLMSLGSRKKCRALPLLLFVDGFGINRNTYRSVKGFYIAPASLSYSDRRKIGNNFTLTLAPHGSSTEDVVLSFQKEFRELEKGVLCNINGESVLMNPFILCYTGDMPQMAANSGFLSHRAHIGCRFCYVKPDERPKLDYDTVLNGRYHFEVQMQRKEGSAFTTAKQRKNHLKDHGLQESCSPFEHLTPAVDLVMSRTCDIPHSEWKGLSRVLQDLLMEEILTAQGRRAYVKAFQHFPMPTGWPRIQNPSTHRGSWSLSELGRATLLTPLILQCEAKPSWFKPSYLTGAELRLTYLRSGKTEHLSVDKLIVCAYGVFATAISAIGTHSTKFTSSPHSVILAGRKVYQALIKVVSHNTSNNSIRSEEWKSKLGLPNVHIGLHLPEFAAEYGSLMNCNVLAGELKHK